MSCRYCPVRIFQAAAGRGSTTVWRAGNSFHSGPPIPTPQNAAALRSSLSGPPQCRRRRHGRHRPPENHPGLPGYGLRGLADAGPGTRPHRPGLPGTGPGTVGRDLHASPRSLAHRLRGPRPGPGGPLRRARIQGRPALATGAQRLPARGRVRHLRGARPGGLPCPLLRRLQDLHLHPLARTGLPPAPTPPLRLGRRPA